MDVGFILNLPWLREFFFFYYASCHHFPMLYVFHGLAFHSYQLQINLDEEKVVFFLLLLLHSFQHVCYLWGVMYGPVWCGIYMNIEHALYRWWWWHTIYSRCARAKRYWNYNGGEGKFLYQFFFYFASFASLLVMENIERWWSEWFIWEENFYWFVTRKDLIFDVNLI